MIMSRTDEDFELELRTLPGVVNVGLIRGDNGDVGEVILLVSGTDATSAQSVATQIASLYYPDATVSVERAVSESSSSFRDNTRVVLVRADYDTSEGACEVQLAFNGRMGVGRAGSGPLIGGAEATLAALRDLGYDIPFSLMTVTSVTNGKDWPVVVTLRSLSNDADRFGIARSDDDMVSAVKATLDSLNRFLSTLEGRQ
jgi:hypothetical protein